MPHDINLLPEEFRDKERKEIEAQRKKPKVIRIAMTSPPADRTAQVPDAPKPSLLSRLFSARSGTATPLPPKPSEKSEAAGKEIQQATEKELHIPASQTPSKEIRVDLLSGGFLFGRKETPSAPLPEPEQAAGKLPRDAAVAGKPRLTLDLHAAKKQRGKKKRGTFFERLVFGRRSRGSAGEAERDFRRGERETEIDVNLIPYELSSHPELEVPKKLFTVGVTAFVALLLVAVAYLGITWYQLRIAREIRNLEQEIVELNDAIKNFEQQRRAALSLQDRLRLVRELLNNHIYWTKFFAMLEKYTLPEVYFTSFAMSGTEDLTLSAETDGYRSVARQLVVLQQAPDFVEKVDINSAAANYSFETGELRSVAFTISLKLQPDVFRQPLDK